jgi:hypothetical protein
MTTQANVCQRCGKPVRFGVELCNSCIEKEARGWTKDQAPRPKSLPGCVIVYALLTLLGGVGMLCSAAVFVAMPASAEFAQVEAQLKQVLGPTINLQTIMAIYMLVNGLVGLFYLAVGVGLFLRQNWARWGVVFVSIVGVIYSLSPLIVVMLMPQIDIVTIVFAALCLTLPGLLINGYIGYWFVFNGEYFGK